MRRIFIISLLAVMSCFPALASGQHTLTEGERINTEGTIQGLYSVCAGQYCMPGEENIVAAAEDTFVLAVDIDQFYYLPNMKSTLLSRYIGKTVKIKGVKARNDTILVETAWVLEDGDWETFFSPEIREKMWDRYRFAPYSVK